MQQALPNLILEIPRYELGARIVRINEEGRASWLAPSEIPRVAHRASLTPQTLPTVMREGLVGLCHSVRVFLLLDRVPLAFARGDHLGGEPFRHRLLVAAA